ncbi:hypothetical protein Ancab_003424 [Ancistrocladus abbreviatus]
MDQSIREKHKKILLLNYLVHLHYLKNQPWRSKLSAYRTKKMMTKPSGAAIDGFVRGRRRISLRFKEMVEIREFAAPTSSLTGSLQTVNVSHPRMSPFPALH